jgi:hypothetical protein
MKTAEGHTDSTTVNYTQGINGDKLAEVQVIVPASTEFGSDNAAYKFSFVAPVAKDGGYDLDNVEKLSIIAGSLGEGGNEISPNVNISFEKNQATQDWGYGALYFNSFTNSTKTRVAGINPVSSSVPSMISGQLEAMFEQSVGIIAGADNGALIGNYKPASPHVTLTMPQPGNTTGNTNGGTPVPNPSGGIAAP